MISSRCVLGMRMACCYCKHHMDVASAPHFTGLLRAGLTLGRKQKKKKGRNCPFTRKTTAVQPTHRMQIPAAHAVLGLALTGAPLHAQGSRPLSVTPYTISKPCKKAVTLQRPSSEHKRKKTIRASLGACRIAPNVDDRGGSCKVDGRYRLVVLLLLHCVSPDTHNKTVLAW